MTLGIDATNIRGGGGHHHLMELLLHADPVDHGFQRVIVWGGEKTLAELPDKYWLTKINNGTDARNFFGRTLWQIRHLGKAAQHKNCNMLFVPGGSYLNRFQPVICMNQNVLPFEYNEIRRYGLSAITVKFLLLRAIQSHSMRRSSGVIFLTEFTRDLVQKKIGQLNNSAVIPHGLNSRFNHAPRIQKRIETFSKEEPFKIIYVSTIDRYKHQWHVVKAVNEVRKRFRWPIQLNLVGGSFPPALKKLNSVLKEVDPGPRMGAIPWQSAL